jgi:MFS transporter, DHA2 family, multidrug resistance protein
MSNSIALGSPNAMPLPANSSEKANLTSWIAVLAGMIGAFMAILNIQITNA